MRSICFIFLLLLSQISFGQSSVGVNFGLPKYSWSNDSKAPFVISESIGSYSIGLEYLHPFKNKLYWGIDVGIHKFSNSIGSGEEFSSYSAGFKPIYNLGMAPKLLYHFALGSSRLGGFLSLGPTFHWINLTDREFDQSNFRITGRRIIDNNGTITFNPIEQNPYKGRETTKKFSTVLRPELGFSFKASDYSRFLLRFQYGIKLGDPLISRDFRSFQLEGVQTDIYNKLDGDYWTIQVGYQFLLIN